MAVFTRLLIFALTLVQCFAHPLLQSRQAAVLPRDDPFYTPPSDLGAFKLGQIIRSRVTPGPLGGIAQYTTTSVAASYQLMYLTTNTAGDPAAAVTIVIVPNNADFTKLLSYQLYYDSADIDCSPSFALQKGSNETSVDFLLIAAALDKGWVISSPDFEGLDAAFVAGVGSGKATLDSVRAVLASESITGVSSKAKYALWGYSGGALGSEWALEYQPLYAPELTFLGAALGGLTPNATNVLNDVNNGPDSSLAFNGVNGLMAAYSNLSDYLTENLIPAKAADFFSVRTACDNSSAPNLNNQDIYTYFQNGMDVFYAPVPQSVLMWGTNMGFRATPTPPLYVYKAIPDEVSPVADTDALVSKYCSQGATIQYIRNAAGEHVTEAVLGAPGALAWLEDRFNGVSVVNTCTTQDVVVTQLSPSVVDAFGQVIYSALQLILSAPLGPSAYIGT